MGREVTLVSSADETAFAVRHMLGEPPSDAAQPRGEHRFVTSGDIDTFRELGARFLGPEVDTVEAWTWA
jgi:glutamate racemase